MHAVVMLACVLHLTLFKTSCLKSVLYRVLLRVCVCVWQGFLSRSLCESACALHSCTVHAILQAIVTEAPTHLLRLKSCHKNRVAQAPKALDIPQQQFSNSKIVDRDGHRSRHGHLAAIVETKNGRHYSAGSRRTE